jgi:hypothetical protein
MAKNILWYNMNDGSYGSCFSTDLLIINADALTMEDDQALYQAASDGDIVELRDIVMGIYYRQNPEEEPCG